MNTLLDHLIGNLITTAVATTGTALMITIAIRAIRNIARH